MMHPYSNNSFKVPAVELDRVANALKGSSASMDDITKRKPDGVNDIAQSEGELEPAMTADNFRSLDSMNAYNTAS